MQNGTEIYPNFGVTPVWTIVAVMSVIIVLSVNFFGAKILRKMAMRKQKNAMIITKKDRSHIVDDAIAKLQAIKVAYESGQKSGRDSAYEASQITRQVFDQMMNHGTSHQARYETKLRNLVSISDLLDTAYPPEFTDENPYTLDITLFDKAIGVLESCR